MKKLAALVVGLVLLAGCVPVEQDIFQDGVEESQVIEEASESDILNSDGNTIEDRFKEPEDFQRVSAKEGSFARYLRSLPLRPHGSKVLYYDGGVKKNRGVYEAVVDMDIGNKDLQQCADAVMRLRGEYLFGRGEYEKIHFNLTNGFRVDYGKWIKGYRVAVDGNETYWIKKKGHSNTYEDFREYMEFVFTYAGTLSLSKELVNVEYEDMDIGDVFIRGGSPGHAVIVVDMAESELTGERLYMLAQSYMPAQDIQILSNPENPNISPWYSVEEEGNIKTPEWKFSRDELKRFERE